MKTAAPLPIRRPAVVSRRARQRGISLYVILIVVMLSMLLALWASRTALFNEMVVGNDADYQRAYEAAQAMIQDAESDIQRKQPDGSECAPSAGHPDVCRSTIAEHFPAETPDIDKLLDVLESSATGCQKGLCRKFFGKQDFWNDPGRLAAMTKTGVGARFGQFTGADPTVAVGKYGTHILSDGKEGKNGAWYWIEVFHFDNASGFSGTAVLPESGQPSAVSLSLDPAVVYRITAIAWGIKQGTRVVLQENYVPWKLDLNRH
ncbi:MAG: hypothetical protein FWG56_05995 [Desulfovibrionaceae bacterium]|nr:hypothetical protein [Desulfovibrionaceae bacterium]